MKYTEIIQKYCKDKTGLFINGMGIGKIIRIEDDFIVFEIIKKEEDNKKLIKEITLIPVSKIENISEGEKEIPKSKEEEQIDNDLESL